jgi:hypothetical protein
VGARLLDQRHFRLAFLAERVAKTCNEFEPAGPAANDDNAMESFALGVSGTGLFIGGLLRRLRGGLGQFRRQIAATAV